MTESGFTHSLLYLWKLRTLYIGDGFELPTFTPASSALIFTFDRPISICDCATGETMRTRSALIPAGVKVEVELADQILACCYLDPLGLDLFRLKSEMQFQVGSIGVGSRREAEQLQLLDQIYQTRMAAGDAYQVLLQKIFPGAVTVPDTLLVDARIAQIVEIIRQDPISNTSNQVLAQQVGLSETQLQRMFKQVVGIPVRRYRLWHRLFVTANYMALGQSLTDAAHAAGFSDSSHFNHTFRNILGMKPSSIFRRRDYIQIMTGGDDEV